MYLLQTASSGQAILCFHFFLLLHLYWLCCFFFLFFFFLHPRDFLAKVSVDCVSLHYLMSKSCSVPWQPPSSPPTPKFPSPIHPALSIPSGCVCSIPPHPGTSQNSPVTPYVLVPCLHFPPLLLFSFSPRQLAIHRTFCFTLCNFFFALFSQNFFWVTWGAAWFSCPHWVLQRTEKMDDGNHKNRGHCSYEHSEFRSTLAFLLLLLLLFNWRKKSISISIFF